jgi:hypothetical protein
MPTIKRTKGDAYVAFLDVLGFKALVENNSHEELSQIYDKALLGGVSFGLSNRQYASINGRDGRVLTNDITVVPVNSLIVSDSIIIWTEDDSRQSFQDIVSVVRGVMAHSCFEGLPLRGAISVGPVSWFESRLGTAMHNIQSSVFGIGLTRAYQLEKNQEWAGCVVAHESISRFLEKTELDSSIKLVEELGRELGILEYWAPFKDHCTKMVVVDWVNHPEVQARSLAVKKSFFQHAKVYRQNGIVDCSGIKHKLRNTLRFVRHVFPDADKEGLVAVFAAFNR